MHRTYAAAKRHLTKKAEVSMWFLYLVPVVIVLPYALNGDWVGFGVLSGFWLVGVISGRLVTKRAEQQAREQR